MPVYMAAISLKKLCGWLFLYSGKKFRKLMTLGIVIIDN